MASGAGRDPKVLLLGFLAVLAWLGIGARLFQVQVLDAERYSELALEQRVRRQVLAAQRGTIFDRQDRVMAASVDSVTMYADPAQITDVEATAAALASLLQIDAETLEDRLSGDNRFVYIARKMDDDIADIVTQFDMDGIHFLTEPKRVYPSGAVGAQVLGLVDIDNRGIEGLEFQYEEVLGGVPGEALVERDPSGVRIPLDEPIMTPAVPGTDLASTIDLDIQWIAEEACDSVLASTRARECAIVVMEAKTGGVLAMAASPRFVPGELSSSDAFRNPAVRTPYEPGSTQKIVTVAAAIEEGAVNWDSQIFVPTELEAVEGACEDEEDDLYGCYTDLAAGDVMTVRDIVAKSSNTGTILIQQELGADRLRHYLDLFGYGAGSGIDYPGERDGAGSDQIDPTCGSCAAAAAIGYNVALSPVQLVSVYSAIANDGVWIQPHLVESFIDSDGQRIARDLERRRVVSPDTAYTLRRLLESVVHDAEGTGIKAAVDGYRVGGKTGTTELYVSELGRYGDDVVASFVGMAPIEHPELVVGVFIEAPQGQRFGGDVAAPVFADVLERSLHQLGVPAYG